jgi:hypothetical protein
MESIASTASLPDFRPIWASGQPKNMTDELEAQNRKIVIGLWEAEHRTFQIGEGSATEVRAKTFYYPYWIATADGKRLETRPDVDGVLLISIPDKAVSVELNFCEPTRVSYSDAVSILAWVLIAGCLLVFLCRKKIPKLTQEVVNPDLIIDAS